jgi:hypothetical protein
VSVEHVCYGTNRSIGNLRTKRQRTGTVRDSGQFPVHIRSFSRCKAVSRTAPRVLHWHCLELGKVTLFCAYVCEGGRCACKHTGWRVRRRWIQQWLPHCWALLCAVVTCAGSHILTFSWSHQGLVCDRLLHDVLFVLSSLQVPFAKFAHLALRSERRLSLC